MKKKGSVFRGKCICLFQNLSLGGFWRHFSDAAMGSSYSTPPSEETTPRTTDVSRPAPTEYVDEEPPSDFLAFTARPCVIFSVDGRVRIEFPSSGTLETTEWCGTVGAFIVNGAEFELGHQSTTINSTSLVGPPAALKALHDNPYASIIVDAAVTPHLPRTHMGDVYILPHDPHRSYKNVSGEFLGTDGLDLYRAA